MDIVTRVVPNPSSLRICLPFYLRYEEVQFAVTSIENVFNVFAVA
jgi:kynureninase